MTYLKTMIKNVCMLLCTLLLAAPAVADNGMEEPHDMLNRISEQVISELKEKRMLISQEPDMVYDLVDQYILPHLDDVTMAKLALGKNWRKASNEEKIQFVDEFRTLLVRTYSKSLQEFSDEVINFFPSQTSNGKAIVKSEVIQNGGTRIPVSYRMRIKDDSWKVYDISIDGVSLVTSYRGTFAQEVRKGGIDGLLKMLRAKNSSAPETPSKAS